MESDTAFEVKSYLAELNRRRKASRATTYLNELIDLVFRDFEDRLAFFCVHEEPFPMARYEQLRKTFFITGNRVHNEAIIRECWEYAKRKNLMGEQFLKMLSRKLPRK